MDDSAIQVYSYEVSSRLDFLTRIYLEMTQEIPIIIMELPLYNCLYVTEKVLKQ